MIPFTLIVVSYLFPNHSWKDRFDCPICSPAFVQVGDCITHCSESHLLQIICGEFLSVYLSRIKHQSFGTKYVACVYKAVGSYVFGAAASQSLTDIAKYSIGRLRPNFLAVCKPVWDRINCKTGGYIENFTCTGDKFLVDEAR